MSAESSAQLLRLKNQAEKDDKALLAKEDESAHVCVACDSNLCPVRLQRKTDALSKVQAEREQEVVRVKTIEDTMILLRKELDSAKVC
jgi:hypothetical protein